MCGIVGVAGKIDFEARKVFKDMLDVCQVRGRDATGVIRVKDNLDYTWVKREGPPAFLFDTKHFDKEIETGLSSALIGHCRAKTNGPSGHQGAHPFDYPEQGIVGVHNGTLTGHHNLEGHSYQRVDSDVLYNHLAVHGVQDTFSKTKGAWACVWWNNEEETLNFIRNDQRPLWFTYSADKNLMFWASEPWMFGAVSRKIKLWEGVDIKDSDSKQIFMQLPINTLWSFSINRDAKAEEPVFILKKQQVIEPFKEEVRRYTGNYGQSGTWKNGGWVENDKGLLVRKDEGGSVPRPFDKKEDELDDQLPTSLLPVPQDSTGKAEELTNTELSNVHYLNTSAKPSASSTDATKQTNSSPKTDLLQGQNTKNSQANSKNDCSAVSRDLKGNSSEVEQFKYLNSWPMVSLRRIAGGLIYITDKLTGNEYGEAEFEDNTRATCSHCDEPIGGLEDVSFFVDKFNFVCRKCSNEKVKKVA